MKTLNDVINAVQHETQLSRSQLSLKIGKSRNYLNTTVKNGLSYEKEQEVIALLLDLVDDEVTMLRREIATLKEKKMKRHMELIEYENKYGNIVDELNETIATKDLFIDGLDMENKGLMDRISKLEKDLKHMERVKDKSCELNDELIRDSNKLMSKIEGLEKELDESCSYADKTQSLLEESMRESLSKEKTIQSMKEVMRELGIDADKKHRKNRILTASIIGLLAIFSVYVFLR